MNIGFCDEGQSSLTEVYKKAFFLLVVLLLVLLQIWISFLRCTVNLHTCADPTCAASLLSTSSCLLLISGVPGQLPPPPASSPPPPLPRESWEKETASTSGVRIGGRVSEYSLPFKSQLTCKDKKNICVFFLAAAFFILNSISTAFMGFIHCMTSWVFSGAWLGFESGWSYWLVRDDSAVSYRSSLWLE